MKGSMCERERWRERERVSDYVLLKQIFSMRRKPAIRKKYTFDGIVLIISNMPVRTHCVRTTALSVSSSISLQHSSSLALRIAQQVSHCRV